MPESRPISSVTNSCFIFLHWKCFTAVKSFFFFFFPSQHYTCYGLTVSLCVNTHPFIYKFPFMLQIKGMSDVELWWEHYSGSCSQPSNNRPVLKCSLIAEWRSHPFWSQGDSKNGLNWTEEDTGVCTELRFYTIPGVQVGARALGK